MWAVSIHASAREATGWRGIPRRRKICFQSTPPHGRRLSYFSPCAARPSMWFQSTPPHGRRRACQSSPSAGCQFQSTPPHGRRQVMSFENYRKAKFQSTPPHGRRHPHPNGARPSKGFNPRLRTGGDGYDRVRDFLPLLFQSTPPHGRRRPHARPRLFCSVSIHASAREATRARQ